ncbi:MAG: Trk system potassium transporter TrkA [Spirochaetes bacterium]|nr:Trk system potassium transporter TrkA [Spirochaetota bacterium]
MYIVINGGNETGMLLAQKLINENHNVTIIEEEDRTIKILQAELDAKIIKGSGIDINVLKKADLKNAGLFISVSKTDNINLLSSVMARKICPKKALIIAKIENSNLFFDEKTTLEDYGIDTVIDPKELKVQKILKLVDNPKIIEHINYTRRQSQLIGIKIYPDFKYIGFSLKNIANDYEDFKDIRVTAILRNEKIVIPKGNEVLLEKDKVFMIGKTEAIDKFVKKHLNSKIKLKHVVLAGANVTIKNLSKELIKLGKTVTIIEHDLNKCKELSKEADGALIINGYATEEGTLHESKIENSCFISLSNDNEYNIISAAMAKKYNAAKSIALIDNPALAPLVSGMSEIDAVVTPHSLIVSEILRYCRKGNIISVTSFSELQAETIGFVIKDKIPILNIPLKNVKFPPDMIIGVLIRGENVIIPTGDDIIKLNDKVIIFVLPSAIKKIEKFFVKGFFKK